MVKEFDYFQLAKDKLFFGQILFTVRKALGMTQEEMAKVFDVSRDRYIKYEKGGHYHKDPQLFCERLSELIKDRCKTQRRKRSNKANREEEIDRLTD